MCGRYQLRVTWNRLAALYRIVDHPEPEGLRLPLARLPRWSVAPTQTIPGVRFADGSRTLTPMRWGFPMTWLARQGKDPWSRPLINAKSEEAAKKRTWSRPLKERRCIVPATAFYEWVRKGKERYPVVFRPRNGELLHLGAVWQRFQKDGEDVDCVSILTTAASKRVSQVHHRMPVLFTADSDIDAWLSPEQPLADLTALMQPADDDALSLSAANRRLNHWSAEGDDLLEADWDPTDLDLDLDLDP